MTITGGNILPTYANNATSNTLAGEPTLFSLNWTSDLGMDRYIFSTNNTGVWKNSSYFFGTGNSMIIDNYTEGNRDARYDNQEVHPSSSGDNSAAYQCFATIPGYKITKAYFYLMKTGSPVGNLISRIYDMSGTYGTTAVPTGSALASSSIYAMENLTGSYQLIEFDFTPFNMSSDYYCISVEDLDATTLNTTDYVRVGFDGSSPTHAGNGGYYDSSSWHSAGTAADLIFYVYAKFSDGFESGDALAWTGDTIAAGCDIDASADTSYHGSYSADASIDGNNIQDYALLYHEFDSRNVTLHDISCDF